MGRDSLFKKWSLAGTRIPLRCHPQAPAATISGCGFCHKAETSLQTWRRGSFAPRLGSARKDGRGRGYFTANRWSQSSRTGRLWSLRACWLWSSDDWGAPDSQPPGLQLEKTSPLRPHLSLSHVLPCNVQHLTSHLFPTHHVHPHLR